MIGRGAIEMTSPGNVVTLGGIVTTEGGNVVSLGGIVTTEGGNEAVDRGRVRMVTEAGTVMVEPGNT